MGSRAKEAGVDELSLAWRQVLPLQGLFHLIMMMRVVMITIARRQVLHLQRLLHLPEEVDHRQGGVRALLGLVFFLLLLI